MFIEKYNHKRYCIALANLLTDAISLVVYNPCTAACSALNGDHNMTNTTRLVIEMLAMIDEGMQPLDCLYYATSEGIEYPDAVYLVTRALKLNDDAVFELEEAYL